jgi:predicted Rossmann-fold nucleotide-binding protein
LEEAFEIITWKQLQLHAKPIVVLDTNGYWQPLVRLTQATVDGGFAHERSRDLFSVVATVEEIIPALRSQPAPDRVVLDSHL